MIGNKDLPLDLRNDHNLFIQGLHKVLTKIKNINTVTQVERSRDAIADQVLILMEKSYKQRKFVKYEGELYCDIIKNIERVRR